LAVPLLLLVICCGFYWRLILSNQYTWLDSPDLVHMEAPRLQFQAVSWHQHQFPLWDPHQWCGQPFLGQIVGAASPLNWIFSLVAVHGSGKIPIGNLHWYFVVIHFLGGLFAYWLCRDLERSRAASLAGALVFALCGFFGSSVWPPVMAGFVWAPLVFLFLLRVLRGCRPAASAALCGMFLGISWLSGHHEVPIYLSFAVAGVWLYGLAADAPGRMRLARLAALAVVVAALTSGLQTIPGYEYAQHAVRWVGGDHPVGWKEAIPYSVDATYSFRPGSLPGLLVPWLAADTNGYIGIVAFVLALLGVVTRWGERGVRILAAVALLALALAMGTYDIFHGILYAVAPLFGKARLPGRLIAVFDLAAAPLAAYGLDALLARGAMALTRRLALGLAAAGAGIYAVALGFSAVRNYQPNENVMFAALIALVAAGLLAAWNRRAVQGRFMVAALLGVMLAEFGMVSGTFTRRDRKDSLLRKLTTYNDIAAYLQKQPGPVRVDFDESLNFGDWEGIDCLNGFGAGVTSNILQLEWPQPRTQDLLAVTHTIARASNRPGQVLVFQGSSGYNVYQNPSAFPRVWAVHRAVRMKNVDEVRAAIRNAAFDLRATAPMLEAPPALETCAAGDEVRMTGRRAGEVTMQARMGCRGMVVVADTWYPGWQATVDGHAATIYEPYLALRGVVVGGGAHTVVLRYRPFSVLLGGGMTLAGVLLACVLAWRGRAKISDGLSQV
jgi:hypothetical protein